MISYVHPFQVAAMRGTGFSGAPEEFLKHESGVARPGGRFRMKLDRPERQVLVPDSFVRTIIQIDEPGLPITSQSNRVDCVTVVLARQIRPSCHEIENGLIVRTV